MSIAFRIGSNAKAISHVNPKATRFRVDCVASVLFLHIDRTVASAVDRPTDRPSASVNVREKFQSRKIAEDRK